MSNINENQSLASESAGLWFPLAVLVAGVPLLFIILFPGDWAGWLVLYFTGAIPFLHRPLRRSRSMFVCSLLSVLVFIGLAIVNSYFTTLPGGDADSKWFLRVAELIERTGEFPPITGGAMLYSSILGGLFSVFGVSTLLAHALSALASGLSLATFVSLRNILAPASRRDSMLVILFSFLPSALFFRAAVLRESWEGLFFLLSVLLMCRILLRLRLKNWLLLFLVGAAGASLHSAFALFFALSLVILAFVLTQRIGSPMWVKAARLSVALVFLVPVAGIGLSIAERDDRVSSVLEGGVAETESSLELGMRGAASYAYSPGMGGNLFLMLAARPFYYWLAPFPWQARGVGDLIAMGENLVRLILLMSAVMSVVAARNRQRQSLLVVAVLSVILLEAIWSFGTSNWGTAMRHHVPAFGVLCAVAFSGSGSRPARFLRFR